MTDDRLAEIEQSYDAMAHVAFEDQGLNAHGKVVAMNAINELIAEVRRLRAEVDRIECDRDRTEEAFALFRASLDDRVR